jgi:hypothetical protein
MRELLDRLGYRYRLWIGEQQGDKVGAGAPPVHISPKNEPAWRMVLRFFWPFVGGVILLAGLGRVAARTFPGAREEIAITVIVLASVWCGTILFVIAGEWLAKRSERKDNDEVI